jgi:hypothetical protein
MSPVIISSRDKSYQAQTEVTRNLRVWLLRVMLLNSGMIARSVLIIASIIFIYGEVVRADDDSKMSGSTQPIEYAALSRMVVFVGKVKSVSAPTLMESSGPGISSYETDISVSQDLIGTTPERISLTAYTYNMVRPSYDGGNIDERPPQVDGSYLFFADSTYGKPGNFTALKILPATERNMSSVRKTLTESLGIAEGGKWRKLAGSSMKVTEATKKSNVILIGEIESSGSEVDQGADTTYGGPLLRGVKVKVTNLLRGSIGSEISLSLYVGTLGGEKLPQVAQMYIFFVQTKGVGERGWPYNLLEKADADTIGIKMLSPTDDDTATVKGLIPSP